MKQENEGAAVRMDDLGLPERTDPASFARAFGAIARERADRAAPRERHRPLMLDELGLPVDGSPVAFAKAFDAVRSTLPAPPLRRRR
jgi:hypothetical protein